MKNISKLITFTFLIFYCCQLNISFAQSYCGTVPIGGLNDNPDSFRGGFYKPARSDIGGAPEGEDYFPVLVVFVQFKNETGDSTSTDFNVWPARKKPNYFDNVIDTTRKLQINWWDSYNGFAVSDYWHEFSRGKLHVIGKAEFIILSHEIDWYSKIWDNK